MTDCQESDRMSTTRWTRELPRRGPSHGSNYWIEISVDNRDKAGRKTALLRHDALGATRERADVGFDRHVFGEV
jgi:hypothetical protein